MSGFIRVYTLAAFAAAAEIQKYSGFIPVETSLKVKKKKAGG